MVAMSRASQRASGTLRRTCPVRRATATTPCPASISRATTAPPISPVAPVTSTRMRHLNGSEPAVLTGRLLSTLAPELMLRRTRDQPGDEGGEIAAREQVTGDPGRLCGADVGILVADQEAAVTVDRPVPHQIEDHAGAGLAPIADPAIGRDGPLRVIGAVAEIVDAGTRRGELGHHMRMHRGDILLAVEAARDAGLVGHDKDKKTGIVEQPDRLARALDPAEARDFTDIAFVVIEDAVAVEKRGRPARASRSACPSS